MTVRDSFSISIPFICKKVRIKTVSKHNIQIKWFDLEKIYTLLIKNLLYFFCSPKCSDNVPSVLAHIKKWQKTRKVSFSAVYEWSVIRFPVLVRKHGMQARKMINVFSKVIRTSVSLFSHSCLYLIKKFEKHQSFIWSWFLSLLTSIQFQPPILFTFWILIFAQTILFINTKETSNHHPIDSV